MKLRISKLKYSLRTAGENSSLIAGFFAERLNLKTQFFFRDLILLVLQSIHVDAYAA